MAYTIPPIWAHYEKASLHAKYISQYGHVSGSSLLLVDIYAWAGAFLMSSIAVGLGWMSFRKVPRPKHRGRIAELIVLAMPPVLPFFFIGLLYAWFSVV